MNRNCLKIVSCLAVFFVFACVYAGCKKTPMKGGFVGTFGADLSGLPGPARKLTLTLNADHTAVMTTDFYGKRPQIVESGTWREETNGTLVLSLKLYDEGVIREVVTFEPSGGSLVSTKHDQNLYGTEALKLKRQY